MTVVMIPSVFAGRSSVTSFTLSYPYCSPNRSYQPTIYASLLTFV